MLADPTRLGAERAVYSTALFPVVALNVSAWAEGYQWTLPALLGLLLVMPGALGARIDS